MMVFFRIISSKLLQDPREVIVIRIQDHHCESKHDDLSEINDHKV